MDFLPMVTAILISLFCLLLLILPFFEKKEWDSTKRTGENEGYTKEELYATLNELELDYNMNKISDDDFARLKGEYEGIIARIMKKEQRMEKVMLSNLSKAEQNELENELEKELEAIRNMKGKG